MVQMGIHPSPYIGNCGEVLGDDIVERCRAWQVGSPNATIERECTMSKKAALVAMASIAVAVALSAPANADPDVGSSDCVLSGQTQQYCIARFIETIETIPNIGPPVEGHERDAALREAVYTVNKLLKALPSGPESVKATYNGLIQEFLNGENGSWADENAARGFINASVHWFGIPNMKAAIDQALQ
jgi:hypothetical protein